MPYIAQILLFVYLIIGLRKAQINLNICKSYNITVSISFTLRLILFWLLDAIQFKIQKPKEMLDMDQEYDNLKDKVLNPKDKDKEKENEEDV